MSLPTAPLHSSLTTTLAFLTIPLLYRAIHTRLSRSRQHSPHSLHLHTSSSTSSSSSSNTSRARSKPTTESTIRPPFPPVIRHMLSSCRLAYLSTVDGDSAHLSLMRFTYMRDDDMDQEIIVMSTQRRTKKFEMLRRQRGVALLVHDFPQHGSGGGGEGGVYSITLNGDCTIVEEGERSTRYRAAHLEHNPDYPQFIVGDDIAMLCVNATEARICNIDDQVTRWNATDGTSV